LVEMMKMTKIRVGEKIEVLVYFVLLWLAAGANANYSIVLLTGASRNPRANCLFIGFQHAGQP